MPVPRCPIHNHPLALIRFCPKCRGALGGRVRSDAQRAQLAAAQKQPRPGRRKKESQ
jgi:hypothetical protein